MPCFFWFSFDTGLEDVAFFLGLRLAVDEATEIFPIASAVDDAMETLFPFPAVGLAGGFSGEHERERDRLVFIGDSSFRPKSISAKVLRFVGTNILKTRAPFQAGERTKGESAYPPRSRKRDCWR